MGHEPDRIRYELLLDLGLNLERDQLEGFACIMCAAPGPGGMVPILTPGNPYSTMVFACKACPEDAR